jgi:hypothetical protein
VTSIVGVLCSDGVVIGTDSIATFDTGQYRTIEQQTEKIDIIGSSVIVAGTGSIGLHQRFAAIVRQAHDGSLLQTVPITPGVAPKAPTVGKVFTKEKPLEIAKTLSRAALEDMGYTYLKPGQYAALVAYPCRQQPHLCEFAIADFQPELKEDKRLWFVSLGSAQAITDPFLGFIRRAFWRSGVPSVSDAIFAVTWTLQHAIDLNPGGVNGPIRLAVLEKREGVYGARLLDPQELQEHQQQIEETYSELEKLKKRWKSPGTDAVPEVPILGG